MTTQAEKAERFKALHERPGAFLIPNPWDAGSARLLQGLGFEALATTSAGFAQTLGRLDGSVALEEKMAHCRALAAITDVPLSADLEKGFADDPEGAARTIRLAAEAGVVGGSIEDYSGEGIYELAHAVDRVRAAVEAARSLDFPFTLTARAENLLRGRNDLDDTIRRLQAYAEVGADVVYAPGLKTLDDVRAVCRAVDRPVNVLAPFLKGVTLAELAEAGAKRVSIGSALANAVIGAVIRAGREMLEAGSFGWLAGMASTADIRRLFGLPPDQESAR
ncbi:MAG TPA: isocitrate lyase/phosphoenolpyruvate mutase family protein [Woeseiaceae bacterium]|nr:isocitrate lyase/phosphoenolpyruvate mutase family protein [Woeseiaceae bacterium]